MIVTPDDLNDLKARAAVKSKPGSPCFKCGKHLSTPFVLWVGHADDGADEIALHPECASRLAAHLFFDGLLARLDR